MWLHVWNEHRNVQVPALGDDSSFTDTGASQAYSRQKKSKRTFVRLEPAVYRTLFVCSALQHVCRRCPFPGVGNFRVNPRFHRTDVGWNLGLTREFPTPTCLCPFHNLCVVSISVFGSHFALQSIGEALNWTQNCTRNICASRILIKLPFPRPSSLVPRVYTRYLFSHREST